MVASLSLLCLSIGFVSAKYNDGSMNRLIEFVDQETGTNDDYFYDKEDEVCSDGVQYFNHCFDKSEIEGWAQETKDPLDHVLDPKRRERVIEKRQKDREKYLKAPGRIVKMNEDVFDAWIGLYVFIIVDKL